MTQHVNAIFDHGVLRPLQPLDLIDQELVSLAVNKMAPDGREATQDEPTLFELLDEVGLVGCIKDAPADLSSNPRYLEGFGGNGN